MNDAAIIEQTALVVISAESREKARVEAHEAAIRIIESWADVPAAWTSGQITERITELVTDPMLNRDWQEFAERALKASGVAHNALVAAYNAARTYEISTAAAAQESNRQREVRAQARKERGQGSRDDQTIQRRN